MEVHYLRYEIPNEFISVNKSRKREALYGNAERNS